MERSAFGGKGGAARGVEELGLKQGVCSCKSRILGQQEVNQDLGLRSSTEDDRSPLLSEGDLDTKQPQAALTQSGSLNGLMSWAMESMWKAENPSVMVLERHGPKDKRHSREWVNVGINSLCPPPSAQRTINH